MSTQNASQRQGGFWSYLKDKELDYFPTGALRWWLLALVVWIVVVENYQYMMIGPVMVFVFQDFKIGLADWGIVGTLTGVAAMIGGFTISNLSERYGRRTTILASMACYVVTTIIAATSTSFAMFGAMYVIGALVVAGFSPAASAAMRDLTPQTGRALAFGILSAGITGGALLSNGVATLTLPIWPGWRPLYWLANVVSVISIILYYFFFRDTSGRLRAQVMHDQSEAMQAAATQAGFTSLAEASKDGLKIYKDWRSWVLAGSMIWWAVAYMGMAVYVPTFLVQFHGVKPEVASRYTTIFWIIFTFSVLLSGWISDALKTRKTVAAFGGISTGLAFVYLAYLPKGASEGTIATVFFVLGFLSGFIYPAFCAILSENAEEISPFSVARVFGLVAVLANIGVIALNAGVPIVVSNYGWPAVIAISGWGCIGIAIQCSVGRGPWWTPKVEDRPHRTAASG